MGYIILTLITAIIITLLLLNFNKRRLTKRLEKIRAAWGKNKAEPFRMESVSRFANILGKNGFHQLSEQTINDLDFYSIFSFVDRTTSKVGQQFLFRKLVQPTNNAEDGLKSYVDLFTQHAKLREEVQLELLKLSNPNAYYIATLLQANLLPRPKWLNFLMLNIIVVAILLLLSFKFPVCLIIVFFPATANMLIHYWNKGNTFQFVRSLPQFDLMIRVAAKIKNKHTLFSDKLIGEHIQTFKPFQRKIKLLSLTNDGFVKEELSQLGSYVLELIKAIFLVEVFTLFHLLKELETKMEAMLMLFNYVGEIDAALSVASLRAGDLKTCQPTFSQSKKEMLVKNLYHPLIVECSKSDLTISGKSILITGSNMSGKTTFLRTLAINSILAQTIYTCFADEFVSPMLKQFSSIRIDDNLFEGKSYYLQEINIMSSLIDEVESSHQNIFVLDEVFKGTNTVERVASAKAILSYLNRHNNIVVVATHDMELSEMLNAEYDLYHFTETIEEGQLIFDHKIKSGPLKTRNAIKLLELSNYPASIIKEAKELSLNS